MVEIPKHDSPESLPTQRMRGPTIRLTPREREVLILCGHGLSQEEIAKALTNVRESKPITIQTVKNHTTNLCNKLMEKSAHFAVVRALITGEIGIEDVLPEWYEKDLINNLTADKKDTWANLAQRVGTTKQIAKAIGKGGSTVVKHSIDIQRELGLDSRVEMSVIFYAEHPELLYPPQKR